MWIGSSVKMEKRLVTHFTLSHIVKRLCFGYKQDNNVKQVVGSIEIAAAKSVEYLEKE